jgi:hypothetical protein
LTPTLGRQDHTTSPYAAVPFVIGPSASTASRPAFRDDREPPLLVGRDARIVQVIWVGVKKYSENRNPGLSLLLLSSEARLRGRCGEGSGLGFHKAALRRTPLHSPSAGPKAR